MLFLLLLLNNGTFVTSKVNNNLLTFQASFGLPLVISSSNNIKTKCQRKWIECIRNRLEFYFVLIVCCNIKRISVWCKNNKKLLYLRTHKYLCTNLKRNRNKMDSPSANFSRYDATASSSAAAADASTTISTIVLHSHPIQIVVGLLQVGIKNCTIIIIIAIIIWCFIHFSGSFRFVRLVSLLDSHRSFASFLCSANGLSYLFFLLSNICPLNISPYNKLSTAYYTNQHIACTFLCAFLPFVCLFAPV